MAKSSPAITSFNSGEFSPLMAGRIDFKYYASACKKLRNAIPTPQGPVCNRAGTHFVNGIKDSSKRVWLRRFTFNEEQSYMLEFGHLYIRFYVDHGVVGGGSPVEVVTPFTESQLVNPDGSFSLRFFQTGDVMYITSNGAHPLQKLVRTGASSFTLSEVQYVGGPFQRMDPDTTVTVYSSANTGSVTLTSSSALFNANHVGALFLMEQKDIDSVKQWEVGSTIVIGDIRRSSGINYKALTAGTTGSIKPTHTRGAQYDGDAGVQWEFQDPGYGWALISAYSSSTVVTATVMSRLPDGAVTSGNPTTRWAFGAFSDDAGHPTDVVMFRERMTLVKFRDVYGSVAGDFENFSSRDLSGLITKDMAYTATIESDKANEISWMAALKSALLVGTYGEEFAVTENSLSESFGPGNIKSDRQTDHGGLKVNTPIIGQGVLFVQTSGRSVRDMGPAESVDQRWDSVDVTTVAEHITKTGIIQMCYQQYPDSICWALRNDGILLGFTINRSQDVRGWHPHVIAGVSNDTTGAPAIVECIEVLPARNGAEELWMVVKRVIDGSTVRYIEYIGSRHNEGDDFDDVFYVDSGLSIYNTVAATLTPGSGATAHSTSVLFTAGSSIFSSGDVGKYLMHKRTAYDDFGDPVTIKAVAKIVAYVGPTMVRCDVLDPWPDLEVNASGDWYMSFTSISGLDHLEGETVSVVVDGSSQPPAVVVAGSIDLDTHGFIAHAGLGYKSIVVPMPIEAGAADGVSQGKTRRTSRCVLRLSDTSGIKYGRPGSQMDQVIGRDAGGDMDTPPASFTGDVIVPWPDGYSRDGLMAVVQEDPLPFTLLAIFPQLTVQDSA